MAEEITERTAGVVGQVAKVIMRQKLLWGIDGNRRSCKLQRAGGAKECSHFKLRYCLDQDASDPVAVRQTYIKERQILTWIFFSVGE